MQVLTEIPAGVESGWHQHPGEEVGYILAGTVEMHIHDRPTLTLHAGDPFLIPPRTPHNAIDLGPDTGRMLSTYIVEAGPAARHLRPLTTSPAIARATQSYATLARADIGQIAQRSRLRH